MRLTVREHRPFRTLGFALALMLMVAGTIWFVLDYDQWRYLQGRIRDNAERQELLQRNTLLENENHELRERLAVLERTEAIDRQAYQKLQQTLMELQTKVYGQNSELEFFRSVVSATATASGLKVQGVRVEPVGEGGDYRVNLVLTHMPQGDRRASGELTIEVSGVDQQGQPLALDWAHLTAEAEPLSFDFEHFTRLVSSVHLPELFTPNQIRVRLNQEDLGRAGQMESTFSWQEVLN